LIRLYRFKKEYFRHGILSGCFFSEEDLLANESYSYTISFSDCLGKHSEINLEWRKVLEEIHLPQEVLVELHKVMGDTISGYNLTHYLEEYYD
jgi:hypothetical protein